jgi:membrane-associated phospholipid phosphatase
MPELFETIHSWDGAVSGFGESVRWEPLTFVFVLASAWWVKFPLIAAFGTLGDAARRHRLPRATIAASVAVACATLLVAVLKEVFDRARPPTADPTIDPIGVLPASASFPSGHAATAFAAAVAVGLIHPRLRGSLLALAALVALSRVYLGVHYLTDVLVGSALGVVLGAAAVWVVQAVAAQRPEASLVPARVSSAPRRRPPR